MIYPIKLIALVLLATCLICELCSCSNHYSPLDTYIDGQIQKAKDSTQHVKEVKLFLDSVNHKVDRLVKTSYVCPDCGEWGCIYEDIDTTYDGNDLTIEQSINIVCKERNITDTNTIKLISANY